MNPYHLVIVYYRSDFAELLAGALLPLAGMGSAARRARRMAARSAAGRGFRRNLAFECARGSDRNVLAGSDPCSSDCAVRRSVRPLVPGAAAMAAGFGLAAFYILPAAWEQRWVQIAQAVADNLRPAQNFLFTHANDPDFVLFNWKVSWVAAGVALVTARGGRFRRAKNGENFQNCFGCWLLLGVVSIALMFPFSGILWRWTARICGSCSSRGDGSEILCMGFRIFHCRGNESARGSDGRRGSPSYLCLRRSAQPPAQ